MRPSEALAALGDAVRAAKGRSPLAPVTVIVPTNAAGVMVRRWLGAHGGVAAVDMVTLYRLAELIAAPSLVADGRRPVSTPLVDLAVRAVLAASPGPFGEVAEHPSTITALRDLHRELRIAGPAAMQALATASARGRDAALVSSLTAERLIGDWYDEGDLLQRAIALIAAGDAVPAPALVVAFQPHVGLGLEADLLAALGRRGDLRLLLPHTGHESVDAELVDFAARIGAVSDPLPVGAPAARAEPPVVVSTTDADDEVRHAVRTVVQNARDGVPFARMVMVWPADRPYARLVEHHLDAAGVPWNGRPGTLVTERLVPRFLLDLLQVDRRGLRRRDLFDLLADVPVRGADGFVVPIGRWERIAREAGVVRPEHWQPRLAQYAAAARAAADRSEATDDAGARAIARAAEAERLADFVRQLQRDLGHPAAARRWSEWAAWCEHQIEWRLGDRVLGRLDEAERLAADHTGRVLDRLRHLDAVGVPVRRSEFRAVFAAEFDVAPGRLGRIGTGVTIGSLSGTVGLDAELVIVLGAADGLLPPAPVIDPLVSDADRRAAGLASADARTRRAHRAFLTHVQCAPRLEIGVPRGDLRATTDRLPSRWIAAHTPDAVVRTVSSHHAGLVGTEFPAANAEHRLRGRVAVAASDPGALAQACRADPAAARALQMRTARRSDELTEYDGDLSGVTIAHFERPVSPSQLESWPKCPHAYFVQYLLGVRPLDDATDDLALSPIERGNVVHATLDRFNHLVLIGDLPQPGPDGWTLEHAQHLLAIYDEVADDFERTGRTGRAAHWHLDRVAVRADLLEWFALDGATASARRSQIISSELRFGHDGDVTLPVAGGRRLAVHGSVDRIDRRPGGDLVVMDHKTGSDRSYRHIAADDPTEAGTRFQLPAYAAAALAVHGAGDPLTTDLGVLAEYDFFAKGGYQRLGYQFDRSIWQQVADDLAHVIGGIESGLFPAVTGPPQYEYFISCRFCQPDELGVHERFAEWEAKRHDRRLAPWFPPDDDGDTSREASS